MDLLKHYKWMRKQKKLTTQTFDFTWKLCKNVLNEWCFLDCVFENQLPIFAGSKKLTENNLLIRILSININASIQLNFLLDENIDDKIFRAF